ncbi:MAG: hypothetical protein DI536_05190 [Archangium gephyra]|uniref:Uncharacterized protein n=1 Tax=Archangium gephyra TaxID=48 RepID=A0A2W5TTC4_9BACT|nr:MAG: hypothetical protein DI536_05190 [Archangium gephyra]
MSKKHTEVKSLQQLRDEIRLKLHLASMDAKDEWDRLEPQVEHALATIDSVARETVDDLKKRMTELRIRLKA